MQAPRKLNSHEEWLAKRGQERPSARLGMVPTQALVQGHAESRKPPVAPVPKQESLPEPTRKELQHRPPAANYQKLPTIGGGGAYVNKRAVLPPRNTPQQNEQAMALVAAMSGPTAHERFIASRMQKQSALRPGETLIIKHTHGRSM